MTRCVWRSPEATRKGCPQWKPGKAVGPALASLSGTAFPPVQMVVKTGGNGVALKAGNKQTKTEFPNLSIGVPICVPSSMHSGALGPAPIFHPK